MKSSFAEAWAAPLARAPNGVVPANLSLLEDPGLPESFVYGDVNWPGHVSFSRLREGVVSMVSLLPPGDGMAEWNGLLLIGEEWFEGGATPVWCVRAESAEVVRVDVEAERLVVVNASLDELAECLLVFRDWAAMAPQTRRVDLLRIELNSRGMLSAHWSKFCDYVAGLPPEVVIFRPE